MRFLARVKRFKVRLVIRALRVNDGHIRRAASLLCMEESNLRAFVRRYGLAAHVTDYRKIGRAARDPRGPQRKPRRYGNEAWRALG